MILALPTLPQLLHVTLETFISELPATEATCLSFVQKVSLLSLPLSTFTANFVGPPNIYLSWKRVGGKWYRLDVVE
jgi:hypothetical protein